MIHRQTHRSRAVAIAGTGITALAVALLTAATSAAAPSHHPPSKPGKHGGVTSTDIAVSAPPTYYRIPDIAVTTSGTVLATYDRRNGSDSDIPNNIDVLLRRSTDNGRTWSPPIDVVDYPAPQGCGDSSLVVDRDTRRIFLFCVYSAGRVGFATSQPGTNNTTDPNTLHVQVRHSDDDGLTWGAPTDLNPQVKDVSWRGYFASSGHGIQTKNGRLIQPIVVGDAAGVTHSADIYSDDDGATWHRGALLSAGTNESKAVQRSDGTIVQNSRPGRAGYRLISTSTDGAQTFTAAVADPQLPDPSVNGDEIRIDTRSHGWNAHSLLFVNAADQLGRNNLTIRRSCDDGATWPVQKLLHAGSSGYSAMAILPNRNVGVLYESGGSSGAYNITFTSFPLGYLGATCRR